MEGDNCLQVDSSFLEPFNCQVGSTYQFIGDISSGKLIAKCCSETPQMDYCFFEKVNSMKEDFLATQVRDWSLIFMNRVEN